MTIKDEASRNRQEKLRKMHKEKPLVLEDILRFPNDGEKDYDLPINTGCDFDFGYELDIEDCIYFNNEHNEHLYSQFIVSWDSYHITAGIKAYYLYDKLVCIAYVVVDKSKTHFEWVSVDVKKQVATYIYSLIVKYKEYEEKIKLIDMKNPDFTNYLLEVPIHCCSYYSIDEETIDYKININP